MAHAAHDPPVLPGGQQQQQQQHSCLDDTKASLEKIKKQLTVSGRFLLQGTLLKRSETLRKWNQRWFTLDPTTGKMEYRLQRGDAMPKGFIDFDANSTVTVSPLNFQGLRKYDGCCFYIGTPQKKEYFFCTETPGAARAWVATLRAAQLVLKAHKEAVNSLSGDGLSRLGTVAAAVAAANATARESAKEILASAQMSIKAALNLNSPQESDMIMDNLSIMKETLRVKDEELHQLARELRARDSTIKELAEHLSETAEAAEAAAAAAHIMDKERKAARAEFVRLQKELDEKVRLASFQMQAAEEKIAAATKAQNEALQEAHTWRVELGKARERAVVMEAALVRSEESARLVAADAEFKVSASLKREAAAVAAKEEALRKIDQLCIQMNSGQLLRGAEQHLSKDAESIWNPSSESCMDKQVSMLDSVGSSTLALPEEDRVCNEVEVFVPLSEEFPIAMPSENSLPVADIVSPPMYEVIRVRDGDNELPTMLDESEQKSIVQNVPQPWKDTMTRMSS